MLKNYSLLGKNALVLGASQGLGLGVARALSEAGATVIIASRNHSKLEKAITTLSIEKGQQHKWVVIDTLQLADSKNTIEALVNSVEGIDILINNTGGPAPKSMLDTTIEDLENGFISHLLHTHQTSLLLLPHMRKNGFGRIVNILSTSIKEPIDQLGVSNTVRVAVANWAKTLSREVAIDGVTINNVLPGFTDTERVGVIFENRAKEKGVSVSEVKAQLESTIPAGRMGMVEEFAAAVLFLCTPAASYINGVNLPVDGGTIRSL
jgi:3-oxoacyl-[acyl-carrier protein] reductase